MKGFSVLVTREPGGTPISERIRELLLERKHHKMVSTTELLLYAAARSQHVAERIAPALAEGSNCYLGSIWGCDDRLPRTRTRIGP